MTNTTAMGGHLKPKTKQLRAGIYVRVSTKGQRLSEQFRQLRQLAAMRGYRVVKVYREKASAFKQRPAHAAAMADAAMNRIDVLVVWSIDRWGRSLVELLSSVEKLTERGVAFVSAKESAIDTSSAAGKLILSVLAAAAEFERNRLIERTRAGLEGARRRGARVGRPPSQSWDEGRATEWFSKGVSAAEIARRLGVSERTARRNLQRQQPTRKEQ
jgi:DNA invertase Pin-like site-specific DNA recombinase